MPLIHDHAQQPPGGHFFADPAGVTLRGETIQEVLDAIALFRTNNGLPPGNPEAELEADYSVRFPWLISKVGVIKTTASDPVERWIHRLWVSAPASKNFMETLPAMARLATCQSCPHYVPDHELTQETSRRLTILASGRLSDYGVCSIHHWACGMAVLLEKPDVTIPVEGCWAGDASADSTAESSPS